MPLSGNLPPTDTAPGGKETIQDVPRVPEAEGRNDRPARGVRLPYVPGLDGLRALAVIAVLLYHAELPWIPGGFLGVEIFFVISGYLITSLLLAELRQRNRIDLTAFWLRRARRLLPALYLLLVVTLAFAVVFLPGEVARLRDDAIAAFGYVTNWYLVLGHQSYFETAARPSMLQHLWSLAVEEQFYIVWPLLFAAAMVLWRFRRLLPGAKSARRRHARGQAERGALRRRQYALLAILAGAAASTLLMAFLYRPDVDPSRVYYGADTRAAGLLIGAALAFFWEPGRGKDRTGWAVPLLLDVVGLVALGGLVCFCIWLSETQPFLFRGGFASVALTTAVVILVSVHPRAHLSTAFLERWPLRWVGLRSYGIYLWHWPVFMVTRPELDVPIDGWPLVVLRLAATVVLAGLSYRFVETPIRTGALGRAWTALREAQGARRWRLGLGWVGAVGTGIALCTVLGVSVALAQPPAPPSYLTVEEVHTGATGASSDTETPTTTPTADSQASTTPISDAATAKAAPTPAKTPVTVGQVTAIGDSVMVGAAGELQRAIGNPDIDAAVGRQAAAVIDILRDRRAAGQLGDVVIIHIGNNGTFTDEQFDEMMKVLSDVRKVVFVNVKVPRPWEQPNNEVLANGVRRYPNTVLVDWHTASAGRPDFFAEDGYHLQPEGQRVYADLIASQL